MQRLRRIKQSLSYANVIATLALFVALGGTATAAATLARNSVGSAQIRANAVGPSEIRAGAVRSSEIRDRTIALRDIAPSTRSALQGAQGPAGPQGPVGAAAVTERAAVNSTGAVASGTGTVAHTAGTNIYTVSFARDTSVCVSVATLAAVNKGGVPEQPPVAGRITVHGPVVGSGIEVKTYDAAGNPAEAPFHILVAC